MKILFISEPYLDLHLPIIEELRNQGHQVTYIKDCVLSIDWRHCWIGRFSKMKRKLQAEICRTYQRYWDGMFEKHPDLNQSFDLLFVINGCSFHKSLMRRLKMQNANIRSVLYLWDNSGFYDYFSNSRFFDKVLTYDLRDSRKYGAEWLSFYFTKEMSSACTINRFISTVGTNHSGRLEICRKIKKILTERLSKSDEWIQPSWSQDIKTNPIDFRIVDKSLPEDDIIINYKMSLSEVIKQIQGSYIVLDTDRESQTGTTPRFIWALAMGKKIITTNSSVVSMPFYNPSQILVIDRNNIDIPDEFLFGELSGEMSSKIEHLRIDRWVKSMLDL